MNILALDVNWQIGNHANVKEIAWLQWSSSVTLRGMTSFVAPTTSSANHDEGGHDLIQRSDFLTFFHDVLAPLLDKADCVIAHNAQADRKALEMVCARHKLNLPEINWLNTVLVARHVLGFEKRATLTYVARKLGINLYRPKAASDCNACYEIVRLALDKSKSLSRIIEAINSRNTVVPIKISRNVPREEPPLLSGQKSTEAEERVWALVSKKHDKESLADVIGLDDDDKGRGNYSKDKLVQMWRETYPSLAEMLQDQWRGDLEEVCHKLDLPGSGYTKTLTKRLLDYVDGQSDDGKRETMKAAPKGEREMRRDILAAMQRPELVEFVRKMQDGPRNFSQLKKGEMKELLAARWDGDAKMVFSRFSAERLKGFYEVLDLERPRLKAEMVEDLARRFG